MTKTCRQCGCNYRTYPSYISRRPDGGFCSKRCWAASSPDVTVACAQCHIDFPVLSLKGWNRRYCSAACRKTHQFNRQVARFHANVQKTETCWLWTGKCYPSGYAQISARYGRTGHRFSWVLANGRSIPRGQHVLHSCDQPRCVNPDHLSLGTPADNVRDSVRKGRFHLHWVTGFKLDGTPTKRRLHEIEAAIQPRADVDQFANQGGRAFIASHTNQGMSDSDSSVLTSGK